MIKKILFIGLLAALIFPPTAMARTYASSAHPTSGGPQLNLTKEQKNEAAKLRLESQAKIAPYREEYFILRQKLDSMENKSSPKAVRLKSDMGVLSHKIETLQIEHERQFIQLLTPEQKTKYNKLREERKKHLNSYHSHSSRGNRGIR